jgi:DDE superfamily endonuclease
VVVVVVGILPKLDSFLSVVAPSRTLDEHGRPVEQLGSLGSTYNFRLYRSKKECSDPKADYYKKTILAREMLQVFVSWVGERRVELTADSAYCNATVIRELPTSVVVFGAMRPDAVLTSLPAPRVPGQRGRPSKRGARLPKPQALAKDDGVPWQSCTAELYGCTRTVQFKMLDAQWYIACGERLLRIVVVATEQGQVPFRVFFCTDSTVDVARLLETYAGRWGIEVFFREGKQLLGFADSSARKEAAVRRVAPFVGLLYTVLVLWFLEGAAHSQLATPPLRPWYSHKQGLCFADILRAARRAMAGARIFDLTNDSENLTKQPARASVPDPPGQRLAA